MQISVVVAPLPNEAQAVVDQYVNHFGLEAVPIVDKGIAGKLLRYSKDTSVGLIILTDYFHQEAVAKITDIDTKLGDKLFIYTDSVPELNSFLSSMLGEDLNTSMSKGSINISAIDTVTEEPEPFEAVATSGISFVNTTEETASVDTSSIEVTAESSKDNGVSSGENVEVPFENEEPEPLKMPTATTPEPVNKGISEVEISANSKTSEVSMGNVALEDENKRLKDELSTKELLVRNLMQQLEDTATGADTSGLVDTIKELREGIALRDNQIADLKVQITSSSKEDTAELNKQLIDSQTAFTQLDFDFKKLKSSSEADRIQLKALQGDKVVVDAELKKAKERIDKLTDELKALNDRNKTLSEANAELDVLRARVADFERSEGTRQAERVALKDANLKVDNLKADIKAKDSQLSTANDKINQLKETNNGLASQIADLETDRQTAVTESDKYKGQVTDLTNQLTAKSNQINDLNTQLADSKNKNNELQGNLNDKQTEIANLNSQINDLNTQKDVLDKQVTDLNSQLEATKEKGKETSTGLAGQIKQLTAEKQNIESQLLEKDGQIKNSEIKVTKLNELVENLNKQVKSLGSQLAEANDKILASVDKVDGYDSLTAEIDKLKAELANKDASQNDANVQAQAELANVKGQLTEKDNVIDTLTTEKSNLELELEKVKNELESKSVSASDVSDEIANLQHQLTEANSTIAKLKVDNSSENSELERKVSDLEGIKADLEGKLSDANTKVSNLQAENHKLINTQSTASSSVFADFDRMQGIKSANSYKLSSINTIRGNNFMVIGSGSSESLREVPRQIANTINSQPSNHFVVIDISSDSSIDIELGCEKVKSIADWLITGQGDIKDYITRPSSYKNMVLLSTALVYTNDLGFLTIDWDARLNAISSLFGVNTKYIINVGNLNNFVAKIMFNNLSRVMNSEVLVKATPYNIRTMLLMLAGLNSLSNTKIGITEYKPNNVVNRFVNTAKQKYPVLQVGSTGLDI